MAKTIGSIDLASLKNLRDDVTQYFWFESNSSSAWGSGAHVTLYPESQFTDSTSPNYMKGQNIIMNTDGFSIRNGALPMMVLDNNSLDFNIVDTTEGTFTTTATFTATGAQIGRSSSAHSVIDANGQRFYATDGTTQLANIGYGEGVNVSGGTSIAPYYTFGTRLQGDPNSGIGNYSVAEGTSNIAKGYASHAEGGAGRSAGNFSHAEGWSCVSEGTYSHAEGSGCAAIGDSSHAQNLATTSNGKSQTTIGTHNVPDTSETTTHPSGDTDYKTYALIIGNGTSRLARSNALTVDWNGNVVASGSITDGSGNTIPVYDGGHKTMGNINTNSYADKTVSFTSTFSTAPNVVACLSTSGTTGNIGNVSVSVFNVTTTGCTIRVFNNRGSSLSPAIEWIAIGKS